MSKNKPKEIAGKDLHGANNTMKIIMPLLSKYPSRKEWEIACWRKIAKSKELLQLLVTSHERHDLVLRAVATEGLISGKSYREIGRETWLSSQTISGIKKALTGKEYRSYMERSKQERKAKKYDSTFFSTPSEKLRGRLQRTKYGTIRMP